MGTKDVFTPKNIIKTGVTSAMGPASIGTGVAGIVIAEVEHQAAKKNTDNAVKVLGQETFDKLGGLYYALDGKIDHNHRRKELVNEIRDITGLEAKKQYPMAAAFANEIIDKGATKQSVEKFIDVQHQNGPANVNSKGQFPILTYQDFKEIQDRGQGPQFSEFLKDGIAAKKNPANADKVMVTADSFEKYNENHTKAEKELGASAAEAMKKKAHEAVRSGETLEAFNKRTNDPKERSELLKPDAKTSGRKVSDASDSHSTPSPAGPQNAVASAAPISQSPATPAAGENKPQTNAKQPEMSPAQRLAQSPQVAVVAANLAPHEVPLNGHNPALAQNSVPTATAGVSAPSRGMV